MSLRSEEDLSNVQQDMDNVLIEEAKAVHTVVEQAINFALDITSQKKLSDVRIEIDKGTTHRDLWNKYTQGVKTTVPAQKTLTVARNALRDGHSKEAAIQIISVDPEFERIKQKQSPLKAQQYAELAVSAAHRKNLVSQQSRQRDHQKQRQTRQDFENER